MNDPRDKRFHALRKKDRSQLSRAEIGELVSYCDRMLQFVTAKKARRSWADLKSELEASRERSLVDPIRIELTTSSLRTRRSPN